MNSGLINIDLFSVGLAVAANLLLGFVIFSRAPRSATNLLFFLQTIILSLWSVANYLSYQVTNPDYALLLVRSVMFFAVPNSIIFLFLVHTFPSETLRMSKKVVLSLVLLTGVTMIITLSPLLFSDIKISPDIAPQPVVGPGIVIFMPMAIFSVLIGIYFLIQRYRRAINIEKIQLKYLLCGVFFMFSLILIFDFYFPVVLANTRFIPLSAVFTLPFVIFTAYAIFKHHLLNVKVITTEILTFILAVVSFFEVVIADNPLILIFRSGILVLILSFGVLLIKSVRNEVEQREKLEQLNKELEEAKLKLEDLSRFKTQLLSLASHQIKSPLAAIKGFISIMLQGLYGPIEPKIRDTLEKMKHSSDELIDLINSVLDLRKVEEGKMEYSFEKISLTAMVKGVVEEIQPLATGKGLKLESVLPDNEIFVQADKTKLKQVVQNLIDNSIKYTLEGFVRASLKEEDGSGGKEVIFSVTDSGLGLSETLLPHLFAEFVRDDRVKKEIRGTGFGLYIAKNIIEAHGGKIWAESPGEGKGSTFAVRLKEV